MYLLDTNHCSRAVLKDTRILNRLNKINNNVVATCVITQGELIRIQQVENKLTVESWV